MPTAKTTTKPKTKTVKDDDDDVLGIAQLDTADDEVLAKVSTVECETREVAMRFLKNFIEDESKPHEQRMAAATTVIEHSFIS